MSTTYSIILGFLVKNGKNLPDANALFLLLVEIL